MARRERTARPLKTEEKKKGVSHREVLDMETGKGKKYLVYFGGKMDKAAGPTSERDSFVFEPYPICVGEVSMTYIRSDSGGFLRAQG